MSFLRRLICIHTAQFQTCLCMYIFTSCSTVNLILARYSASINHCNAITLHGFWQSSIPWNCITVIWMRKTNNIVRGNLDQKPVFAKVPFFKSLSKACPSLTVRYVKGRYAYSVLLWYDIVTVISRLHYHKCFIIIFRAPPPFL